MRCWPLWSSAATWASFSLELRTMGTTVYFEPSSVSTKADLECVSLSDIIKFSDENVPDTSFTDGFKDKLFVQTRGKDGLCFKLRDGEWKTLPGIPNDNIVDTEGAGDWTTAAIIWGIVRSGKTFSELNEEDIVSILSEAQRFASEKVSYLGSKGNLG